MEVHSKALTAGVSALISKPFPHRGVKYNPNSYLIFISYKAQYVNSIVFHVFLLGLPKFQHGIWKTRRAMSEIKYPRFFGV
jgi:hypothetical protein